MKTTISRRDVNFLVSISLLAASLAAIGTGLAADWWDLNDFLYHKYAGYVLAVLSLIHVYLHGGALVAYTRRRLRPGRRRRSPLPQEQRRSPPARSAAEAASAGRGLSRRDVLPLLLGGAGGFGAGYLWRPAPPSLPYGGDVAAVYHEWSKPQVLGFLGQVPDWGQRPPLYKEYVMTPSFSLPAPGDGPGLSTEAAIRRRRSVRDYADRPLTQAELSRLLYHTGGITGERSGRQLRAAPSAGALYPIEIYAVIHRVEGLAAGLYHYGVADHTLAVLREEELRGAITRLGGTQGFLGEANLVLVFTAVWQRLRWKYQTRSYRYAMLEAGHLGQNAYLAGTSLGLGVCAVGAFRDDELNALLGVNGEEETAVYLLAVGAS